MEKVKTKKNYEINRNNYVSLLLILAIAAGAVAELFAILSDRANSGYPISVIDDVMIYSEIAVVLLVVEFILSTCLKGRISTIILDLLRFGAVALFCICMYYVLVERADLMGYVWFSTLESDNPDSVNALNYGVISAACYVGAIIICAVTGGFDMVTSIKQYRTRATVQAEIDALQQELATYPDDGTQQPFEEVLAQPEVTEEAQPATEPAPAAEEPVQQPVVQETVVYYTPEPKQEQEQSGTDEFLQTLTDKERQEFCELFVNGSAVQGVPAYEIGGDNSEFFSALFIRLSKTRSVVSDGLMSKIGNYYSGR